MRILTTCFLFLAAIQSIFAQDSSTLNLGLVLKQVSNFHPTVKQASLLPKQGESYLRYTRGSFDPKLFFQRKLLHRSIRRFKHSHLVGRRRESRLRKK